MKILLLAYCYQEESRLGPMALLTKIQGRTRLRCEVRADGVCSEVKIISGHPLFHKDTMENLKKWRYPELMDSPRRCA